MIWAAHTTPHHAAATHPTTGLIVLGIIGVVCAVGMFMTFVASGARR